MKQKIRTNPQSTEEVRRTLGDVARMFDRFRPGTVTLSSGSASVSDTTVTADTLILLTCQESAGTPGFLYVSARTAGTGFTITSSSNTDTSTVGYLLIEP